MEHITKVKDLYERTVTMISESEENWREFLECMGRLYQLDYLNTCMVYAQRPDATVLAGFDEWMELNLPVMRGSRGIAIFPSKLFGENVTHVFDVSDTKGPGVRPWNWTVNGTNRRKLAKMLFPEIYEKEKKFKNSLNTFTRTYVWFMIREEDGISKTLQRLKVLTGAEAELEEMEITRFIVDSALYAVESRCGVTDGELDFSLISRYQNEEILYRAGRLVSHLSGKVLFEISKTMKTIDLERSAYYGRDYRNSVQGSGRHSISRVGGNYERGNGNGNTGQVRQDGSQRPAGERSGPVRDDASVGNASSENAGSTGAGGNAARRDRGETGTAYSKTVNQKDVWKKTKIYFGIGRGVTVNTLKKIDLLAEAVGAQIVGTRVAVECGIIDKCMQVGQSGKYISPEIYVAWGISGAAQHIVGIKNANCIIAINKDREAPIFQVADYCINIEIESIIDELLETLNIVY